MAHFAELDEENAVLRVIVFDGEGAVGEASCAAFMAQADGTPARVWKQTSYNATIRGKYAAIGDSYDPVTDAFVSPEPEGPPEE